MVGPPGVYFSGDVDNVLIYNNLFTEDKKIQTGMDGLVFLFLNFRANLRVGIYNNTFVGDESGTAIDLALGQGRLRTRYELKNNIALNVSTFVAMYNYSSFSVISDGDFIDPATNGSKGGKGRTFSASANGSARFLDFAEWRALGLDRNSLIETPLLGKDFRPLPSSSSSLKRGRICRVILGMRLKAGVQRSNDSSWDVGAYEHAR